LERTGHRVETQANFVIDVRLSVGYYQLMKVASRGRRAGRLRDKNSRSNTYNLSTAKTYLGRLADKAMKGEPVYILRGSERFILQAVPDIEPIPMRPAGYFEFDAEDRSLDKRFAKTSVIPALRSE
jgi:hypothetical protein